MRLRGPHRPRPIRFLGVHTGVPGWTVKLYGIAADRELPRRELVDATVTALAPTLTDADGAHGVAFAIAHDAADRCFALIDWFAGENEIHQRLLSAPLGHPSELAAHPGAAIGCVWELAVTDFERRAWLDHVLAAPDGPDLDAYLGVHLEGEL